MRSELLFLRRRLRLLPALALVGVSLAGTAHPARAQERMRTEVAKVSPEAPRGPIPVVVQEKHGERHPILRLAKWGAMAVSAGASVYGFHVHGQADDAFQELQDICDQQPDRCGSRHPDGSFADTDLEGRYQQVLDKDRSARTALILAQVGLATTVVLFILDLGGNEAPPDIPFEPPKIVVGPNHRTEVSYSVALPFH